MSVVKGNEIEKMMARRERAHNKLQEAIGSIDGVESYIMANNIIRGSAKLCGVRQALEKKYELEEEVEELEEKVDELARQLECCCCCCRCCK